MTVTELKEKLEKLGKLGYGDKEVEFEVEGLLYSPFKENAWVNYHGNPLLLEYEKAEDFDATDTVYLPIKMERA